MIRKGLHWILLVALIAPYFHVHEHSAGDQHEVGFADQVELHIESDHHDSDDDHCMLCALLFSVNKGLSGSQSQSVHLEVAGLLPHTDVLFLSKYEPRNKDSRAPPLA